MLPQSAPAARGERERADAELEAVLSRLGLDA